MPGRLRLPLEVSKFTASAQRNVAAQALIAASREMASIPPCNSCGGVVSAWFGEMRCGNRDDVILRSSFDDIDIPWFINICCSKAWTKCSCYFECSILVVSLSVPEHNCLRHGSQRNSTINKWRTYISPFPPNQSLQLILDLDDPNKINTSIFSAVSSCVLWRLRLPLVLLFCNYLFPCRPQKTSFPRKPSLKIIARSYSWLMPIIVVWTILHNICTSYTQYCTLRTPIESTNHDNFTPSIMRMKPMNSKKKISTTYTYHIDPIHIHHITIQWFWRFRGSNI